MRYVTLTKEEFDQIVYPAVAVPRPETMIEARLVAKALDVLEEAGELTPISLMEMQKSSHVPLCRLKESSHTFSLEDAHHDAVVRQLERFIPKLSAGIARRALVILEKVQSAPTAEA